METNISSPRWRGRLKALLLDIAAKHSISFSANETVTLFSLLAKVSALATPQDKQIIDSVVKKWTDTYHAEDHKGISFSKTDESIQDYYGGLDFKQCLKRYGSYDALSSDTDFASEYKAEERKKTLKKLGVALSVAVAVVIAFSIYNLPYFVEDRAFSALKAAPTLSACYDYYDDFPDGRFTEDVMRIEFDCARNQVEIAINYMERFPDGKYIVEFENAYDSIWDEEIAKYHLKDKSNMPQSAIDYMDALLQYMKDNRKTKVALEIHSDVNLKDLDEFPSSSKRWLDLIIGYNSGLSLDRNLVSLKNNFSKDDESSLRYILSEGLVNSFSNFFNPDVLSIVDTKTGTVEEGSPKIVIEYTVQNQMVEKKYCDNCPEVWTYSVNNIPTSYLLGIEVYFDAKFTLPSSDICYHYAEKGEPGESIEGIDNISEGYRRMTNFCFHRFANKMVKDIGLSTPSSPEEE